MGAVYPDDASAPSIGSVLLLFARDANLTFGGGSATGETLRRELEQRRWLSDAAFRNAYAASRLTPATNLLALCAGLGFMLRGWRGSLAALFGASIPSAIIATLAMSTSAQVAQFQFARDALRGAIAVSVALLLSSVWALIRPHASGPQRWPALVIFCVAFSAYQFASASPLAILAGAAVVGAVWNRKQ